MFPKRKKDADSVCGSRLEEPNTVTIKERGDVNVLTLTFHGSGTSRECLMPDASSASDTADMSDWKSARE